MLILRRRVGEIILVGGNVEIEVIEISRTRVKLGVRAPVHVPVIRNETVAVSRENQQASHLLPGRGSDGVEKLLQLLNRAAVKQTHSPGIRYAGNRVIRRIAVKTSQRNLEDADM